jgi:hypothetical protein
VAQDLLDAVVGGLGEDRQQTTLALEERAQDLT